MSLHLVKDKITLLTSSLIKKITNLIGKKQTSLLRKYIGYLYCKYRLSHASKSLKNNFAVNIDFRHEGNILLIDLLRLEIFQINLLSTQIITNLSGKYLNEILCSILILVKYTPLSS
jgi:hypothetical protein